MVGVADCSDGTADSTAGVADYTAGVADYTAGVADYTAGVADYTAGIDGMRREESRDKIKQGNGQIISSMRSLACSESSAFTSQNKACDSCQGDCYGMAAFSLGKSDSLERAAGSLETLAKGLDLGGVGKDCPSDGGDSLKFAAQSLPGRNDSLEKADDSWLDQDSQIEPLLGHTVNGMTAPVTAGQQQLPDWRSVSSLPNCDSLNGSC
jgi:putative membrane protein